MTFSEIKYSINVMDERIDTIYNYYIVVFFVFLLLRKGKVHLWLENDYVVWRHV